MYQSKKKNARLRWKKGDILRNLSVLAQRNDLQKWKDSVSYGQRWMAETVFSCIKRMFGEHVYSIKFKNMVKEMMLKASLYNKMISCLDKIDSKMLCCMIHLFQILLANLFLEIM